MSIAALRQQLPNLRDYTDDELVGVIAQSQGIRPDTPQFKQLASQLLGYDRTMGQAVKDAGVGLVQGVVGLGQTAATVGGALLPGVRAFDNPVVNTLRGASDSLDQFKSPGLRNQEMGAQVAGDIAVRDAAAQGAGFAGKVWAGAKAQGAQYLQNPGVAVQDLVTSAPSLVAGGLVGRGVQGGLRVAGAGEAMAARGGVAGGVAGGGVLQGGDVAGDTFDRMRKAGADYDTASRGAGAAGVAGGLATVGLAAIPGATAIERSMIRGAAGSTGRMAATRAGVGEFVSEGVEEGFGQFMGNAAVRKVDPNQDMAEGVGRAAVQGAVAAGPMGFAAGMKSGDGSTTAPPKPRTETGEIDLTGRSPVYPTSDIRTPAIVRRGLAPGLQTLENTTGIDGQGQIPGWLRDPNTVPPAYREPDTSFADLGGAPYQPTPATVPDLYRPQERSPFDAPPAQPKPLAPGPLNEQDPYDTSRFPARQDVPAPGGQTPLDAAPNWQTAPGATPEHPAVDFTRDIPTGDLAIAAPGQAPAPATPKAEAEPNVGRLIESLQKATTAVGARSVVRKDGEVSRGSHTVKLRSILESKAPLAVMRRMYQDGKHVNDELLDAWHKELTGQTVAEAKAATNTNSAGFVSEPLPQLNAQLLAVRDGRKAVMVLGQEDAAKVDLTGLQQATATGTDGATAVVVSRDAKKVKAAVKRAAEVGLKQAMGEAMGVANPTITSQPTAPEGVSTVQHVDNATGQVIQDEVVTPADLPNVAPIEGTTPRVVPVDQPIADRKAGLSEAAGKVTKTKVDSPRTASKALVKVVESTKDQAEYKEALYQLYARSFGGNDVVSYNYLDRNGYFDVKPNPQRKAELAEMKARFEAERGQERGEAFGATKFATREGSAPEQQIAQGELQSLVDAVQATLAGKVNIEVAEDPSAVGLTAPGATEIPMGVTLLRPGQGRRIILFRTGIANPLEALRTLYHELFHLGLRNLMSDADYHAAMDRLHAADPLVQKYAARWMGTEEAAMRKSKGMPDRDLQSLSIEEALADIAEELKTGNGTGTRTKSNIVRSLVGWMADVANTLGMKPLAQWLRRTSMTEAEKFISDAIDSAGGPGPTGPTGPDGGERFSTGKGVPTAPVAQPASAPAPKEPSNYRQLARQALQRGDADRAQRLLERAEEEEEAGDKYSIPRTLAPIADAAKTVTAAAKAQAHGQELNEPLLNMLTLRQIDQWFGKHLPAFGVWAETIFQRSSKASKTAADADRVAEKWQTLRPAEQKALAELLLRASNSELQLDNIKADYLAELSDADRKEHASLRSKLEALSPEAKAIRKEALGVLTKQWNDTRNALEKFISLTVQDPVLRAARIEALATEFGRNRGDYFPLSRFGDNIVIARGAAADGRDIVTFHETVRSADEEVARLRSAGAKEVIRTKSTETDVRKVASSGFMKEMHSLIDANTMGAEADALHEALQQLYLKSLPELSGAKHMIRRENIEGYSQNALRAFADAVTRGSRYAAHLEFGPAVHAAMETAETQSRSSDKRTAAVVIGRKEGAKPEVRMVPSGTERLQAVEQLTAAGYAVEFFDAHPETVVERLAGALEDATPQDLARMGVEFKKLVAKTEGVEDLRAAKQLYNYMVRSQAVALGPTKGKLLGEKGVELAGQLGYAWYLGFSPAFWAMNTLQNPMVGIPHLGAKYGVAKAMKEWTSAGKWFAGVRLGKFLNDRATPFSVDLLRDMVKAGKVKGLNKNELDMLQRLEDRQVLDFTQAMDLSRIGAASNGTWYKVMRLAAAGAHHTEVFNRVSFALAAYRLALKSSSDVTHEEATRAAERDVAAVHFDYSYANKPMWMGKSLPAARLVFMFQQYRQHMLYWWASTIKDAVKGESKEVKAQARKAALLMGTTQLLFAGTMGLPFMGAVASLATMLGGGDDGEEPFDFERWMREAAAGITGSDKGGDVLTKGIFAALNMDISKRIGQADLLPLLNPGSARYERNFDDKARAYLFDALGPLGSLALNAARSVEAFHSGDPMKGAAAVAPKFLGDVLRAADQGSNGLKDKRGQQLASAEAFDGADWLLQAAGITPLSVANTKAARGAVLDIQYQLRDQAKRLSHNFVEAWSRSDTEGITDALADIQRYNANLAKGKMADRSMLVTSSDLKAAIMDRQRRAMWLAATGGMADSKQQLMIAGRMGGTYDLEGRDTLVEAIGRQYGVPGLPRMPSLADQ